MAPEKKTTLKWGIIIKKIQPKKQTSQPNKTKLKPACLLCNPSPLLQKGQNFAWLSGLKTKPLRVCKVLPAHREQRAGCGSKQTTETIIGAVGLSVSGTSQLCGSPSPRPNDTSIALPSRWDAFLLVPRKPTWQSALFLFCLLPCTSKINNCFSFPRICFSVSHVFLGSHVTSGQISAY